MAAYLDEEMFGRDDDTIGYPHLLFCNGVTVVTENCLYGVHSSLLSDAGEVYHAFLFFCQGRGLRRGYPMTICSAANVGARYPQGYHGWAQEMLQFADIFGHRGQITGFDTSVIDPKDGTYVEVHRDRSTPFRMLYKRNEKTVVGPRSPVPSAGNADVVTYDVRRHAVRGMALPTSSVTGKSSLFHRGTFHEVNYNALMEVFA